MKETTPQFDAVIFDLDGVITQTALVHSQAWKKMFDSYLWKREVSHGEPFREFSHEQDYLKYVDGKPRYDGVSSFLESRGIHIPFGDPSDEEKQETICGLGNRKNSAFNEVLRQEGVKVYDSTVALMKTLRKKGVRIGVASSSKNCRTVLEAAGLMPLVETIVDGIVSAEKGLQGKPAPDIFLTACYNLNSEPARSVVVEDAVSGVAAGHSGNFGLVIGIAREENSHELLLNGADYVVTDMIDSGFDRINHWFAKDLDRENWWITYHSYEPEKEGTREALLTVGNGYLGTRGAMEENNASGINYPGTYIAGLYNRLITPVAGHDVENEDFVNIPNWLCLTFKIDDDDWFDINTTTILSVERRLNLYSGLLRRYLVVRDDKGRETHISSERLVSMNDPHLAALRYSVTPLNYSGKITFRTGLNGNVVNGNVERYKSLNQHHIVPIKAHAKGNLLSLVVVTSQSGVMIAEASNHYFYKDGLRFTMSLLPEIQEDAVYGTLSFEVRQGISYAMIKRVGIYTSKPDDEPEPLEAAIKAVSGHFDYVDFREISYNNWEELWNKMDIRVGNDRSSQKLLRLHLYHLIVSMSPNNCRIDAGITARGLHGEAYRGHIFWDEIFILPVYDLNFPEVARSMLMYRYRRLDKAREYAAANGYLGAMFPWQSGSDGREETQVIHLNPLSGLWDPDHSCLQRHVSLAIACNVWQYFHITNDGEFLKDYGAELFLEICRFWASKTVWNEKSGRYDIPEVMGPDEFHEQYPGSAQGGLTNNAYTNLMVAWAFARAKDILEILGDDRLEVTERIGLVEEETDQWMKISRKLGLSLSKEGIIAQYEGYFDLKELDWEYYRETYGNIYRMDRILKTEGKSPDEYKVAKQADMLMVFYNLDKTTVDALIQQLDYQLPADYLQRNLEYYFKRTSHGSTLSRIVHARLAALAGNMDMSWELYCEALSSDYYDIQGGTTAEGIHAGVMGGTIQIALSTYAGINVNGPVLSLSPNLPPAWKSISCKLTFRGVAYQLKIAGESLTATADKNASITVNGKSFDLQADTESVIQY
ncbi:MAG: beta-phosphoglucomutase family hydrolase [Bacteroidetes bacterium]|nr:beta-phosphoglucomutase family hydrolase [Bacteroidota bacterium]